MGLEGLSDDLLLDIMELVSLPRPEYLHHGNQRNDLLPFIRCSRRLYRLGEPILYQKFIQMTSKTLPKFIKTLLAHPSLTNHVRVVNLTDRGPAKPPEVGNLPGQLRDITRGHMGNVIPRQASDIDTGTATLLHKLSPFNFEEMETVEAIILSLPSDRAAAWIEGIVNQSWDALAALTLCLLPNVNDLQIEKCQDLRWQRFGHTHNLLSHPFPFAVKTTAKLRNLSVSYEKRARKDGLLAIPVSILALPTLRSFSGDMMRETFWKNPSPDTKFSIKSLQLDRCNFSAEALVNLLNSCPELEVFKYEHDEEKQEHPFYPKHLDGALASLEGVLRELILYRTALEPGHIVTDEQFGVIKSLKEFKKLTSLSITAQLLLGPQKMEGSRWYEASTQHSTESQSLDSCLPPSLEHLKLKNCGVTIFEEVTRLIEVKPMLVPNLKSLIIEFVHIRSHYSEGMAFVKRAWSQQLHFGTKNTVVMKLDELCKGAGVEFDIWYN